jgi:ubiquinone/menaquinone biosynthesis C-methylase UbiE
LRVVDTEREIGAVAASRRDDAAVIAPPPGVAALPRFDRGWLVDGEPSPYLSYVAGDPSVNWSDDLEALHEEASRTHFIDRWTRSAVIERVGPLPVDAVVADVGCSTGYLLEDLSAAYPEATLLGVDLIAAGLRKAHAGVPTARLLHADACALPLADGSVDAVVSANLLEHVPDDRQALREIARILRPGAMATLVVPAGPRTYDYYDRFLGHERRYARGELAAKCGQSGLEPVQDMHIASLLYPAFWLVKQRNRLRYRYLNGEELEAKVAADIGTTRDSRVGYLTWRLEDRLLSAGVRLPFGVRSLVVARKGGAV